MSEKSQSPQLLDPRWQIFLRVTEVGSLSKAATALVMPQSMVSRAISHLERQCGERLFERTGRGVTLTEFGARLLPSVTQLAADAEALSEDIRGSRGQVVGEVRIGLLPTAAARYCGPLITQVGARLPGVRLHLIEGASAQLEEHLREGRIDMAVVLRESPDDIGEAHILARVPLHLVGRCTDEAVAQSAIPLAQLSALPLVVPSRPHRLRSRLDQLADVHGLRLHIVTEADSVALQCEVVAAGGGYAIMSIAGVMDARLASTPIVQPALERFVVLALSPRRPYTRATRAVHALMAAFSDGL